MDTILHLEHQGKTARLSLQSLPRQRPKPVIHQFTKTGTINPYKLVNGINAAIDPFQSKPEDFINFDPELALEKAGQILEAEMISTAYFNPSDRNRSEGLKPVTDFKFVDIIYDAEGKEKERRPHVIRKSNLNDLLPVKIGKRLSIEQAFTSFVFRYTYQIVHEDGVTMDFLFNIARELQEKNEVAIVGAGSKGNQPLVVREKGSPYRGFLYGEIGTGEHEGKYKLLLLLSDRELKKIEE
jgi:hypothetical protein